MSEDTWKRIARKMRADDRNAIPYRPRFVKHVGSVEATILLAQIEYWWEKMGRQPFFKFLESCQHERYRVGDSWNEELGFSAEVTRRALQRIGTKVTQGMKKSDVLEATNPDGTWKGPQSLIIYWTDANRVTWYQLNEAALDELLKAVYLKDEEQGLLGKPGNAVLHENHETRLTYSSETTAETTTEDSADAQSAPPVADPPSPPKKERKPRAPDLLFEAVCEHIEGVPYGKASKRTLGHANAICGEVRARQPQDNPVHPNEIAGFRARYIAKYPGISFPSDPMKLARHILELRQNDVSHSGAPSPAADTVTIGGKKVNRADLVAALQGSA